MPVQQYPEAEAYVLVEQTQHEAETVYIRLG